MTFDKELILSTFANAKTVKATADQLGIHYNTIRKVVMASQGRCICGKPLALSRQQCGKCLKDRLRLTQAKRNARIESERCTTGSCRQPLSPESTRLCAFHLELARERQRRYAAKQAQKPKKDQTWRNGSWLAQRELCLKRDEYRCILCAKHGSTIRLHVHHVDGNKRHHEIDNLTTLCIVCHATLTRLLEHSDPVRFLVFLKKQYHISL